MRTALSPEAATAKICRAMRMRMRISTNPERQRLVDAAHEAGHALVCLFDGVDFESVMLAPHADLPSSRVGQLVFHQDSAKRVVGPNLLARVSCDVAGMVGEEVVTGLVDEPPKSTEDLYKGCARLGFSPAMATNADLGPLWDVVRRVRAVLGMRQDAVKALANALAARGQLSRAACVGIAQRAKVFVGEPTFTHPALRADWVGLVREDARVDAAIAELNAWRQERVDAAYGEARSQEATR
ncbi:MAG TPA: hypothetical protein VIJ22_01725 [Polyangiaceae bacterium]